jgi:hypothetical protein
MTAVISMHAAPVTIDDYGIQIDERRANAQRTDGPRRARAQRTDGLIRKFTDQVVTVQQAADAAGVSESQVAHARKIDLAVENIFSKAKL